MSTIVDTDRITFNDGSVMGTAASLGLRNKIINGGFNINQRGYVSGAATTAGQYTLDRWKVTGTGGITFSTTNNKTTVTIPAGQTLQQVIEGLNLQSGNYVVSWEGTAQARVGAGSYGASGAVTATVVGGTNTTLEFNAGTVANVQFEIGTVATPFEQRPYGFELALCQRYYEIQYAATYANYVPGGIGKILSGTWATQKRTTPTVSISSATQANTVAAVSSTAWTAGVTSGGSAGVVEATVVGVSEL